MVSFPEPTTLEIRRSRESRGAIGSKNADFAKINS